MENKEKICPYCNKIYCNKSSLSRHINYYCPLVPPDIKAKLIAKQQKRKPHFPEPHIYG